MEETCMNDRPAPSRSTGSPVVVSTALPLPTPENVHTFISPWYCQSGASANKVLGKSTKLEAMSWLLLVACLCSLLPFLPLHMNAIGILPEDIGLLYSIMALSGCLYTGLRARVISAFGLGNRRLLLGLLITSALSFSCLTALGVMSTNQTRLLEPLTKFNLTDDGTVTIFWPDCQDCDECRLIGAFTEIRLTECNLDCPIDDVTVCEVTNHLFYCEESQPHSLVTFKNVQVDTFNVSSSERLARMDLLIRNRRLQIAPDCSLSCSVSRNHSLLNCHSTDKDTASSGILPLICFLYLLLRMLGTVCISGCLDQLYQIVQPSCKLNVMCTLLQVTIPPCIGAMIDWLPTLNFNLPFMAFDLFAIAAACILINVSEPVLKSANQRDQEEMSSSDIRPLPATQIAMIFLLGASFGLIQAFFALYVQNELNMSMIFLGLTFTISSIVSALAVCFGQTCMIHQHIQPQWAFLAALVGNSIKLIGYSHFTDPWVMLILQCFDFILVVCFKATIARTENNSTKQSVSYTIGLVIGGLIGFTSLKCSQSIKETFLMSGYAMICISGMFLCILSIEKLRRICARL